MALKDDIFATGKNLPCKAVEMEEWDCTVWIPKLTGAQGDELAADANRRQRRNEFVGWRAYLIAGCVQDVAGNPIFDPDSKTDLEQLQLLSTASLEVLSDEIMDYNKIGRKGLEEAAKN
jgi:hypothetical protein